MFTLLLKAADITPMSPPCFCESPAWDARDFLQAYIASDGPKSPDWVLEMDLESPGRTQNPASCVHPVSPTPEVVEHPSNPVTATVFEEKTKQTKRVRIPRENLQFKIDNEIYDLPYSPFPPNTRANKKLSTPKLRKTLLELVKSLHRENIHILEKYRTHPPEVGELWGKWLARAFGEKIKIKSATRTLRKVWPYLSLAPFTTATLCSYYKASLGFRRIKSITGKWADVYVGNS